MKKIIACVAGKSGGHIIPCLTKAQKDAKEESTQIILFCTKSTLDKTITQQYNISLITLTHSSVPYKKIWRLPIFIFHQFVAFLTSFKTFLNTKPIKLISTGGFISIPVCFAAKCLRIPIELYELNIIPGKAVKLITPLVDRIYYCFEQSQHYFPSTKSSLCSYPIRFEQDDIVSDQIARAQIQLDQNKKTILLLGGSQGSVFLNNLLFQWILNHPELHQNIQLIHQIGNDDQIVWQKKYEALGISACVFSYQHDMAPYYCAADIIICRSGAGTLFEIAFFNKPCITIPLETKTTNHQKNNALAFGKQYDTCTVLLQTVVESNKNVFHDTIKFYI